VKIEKKVLFQKEKGVGKSLHLLKVSRPIIGKKGWWKKKILSTGGSPVHQSMRGDPHRSTCFPSPKKKGEAIHLSPIYLEKRYSSIFCAKKGVRRGNPAPPLQHPLKGGFPRSPSSSEGKGKKSKGDERMEKPLPQRKVFFLSERGRKEERGNQLEALLSSERGKRVKKTYVFSLEREGGTKHQEKGGGFRLFRKG